MIDICIGSVNTKHNNYYSMYSCNNIIEITAFGLVMATGYIYIYNV